MSITSRRSAPLVLLALVASVVASVSAQPLVPDDDVPGVLIEQGYNLRLVVDGLNYPSNVAFGSGADAGRAWVTESGYAAPNVPPSVTEVTLPASGMGTKTILLTPGMLPLGRLAPPFTDVTWRGGMLYLGHRQSGANGWTVGAYSRFSPSDPVGTFETLVTNLPSVGDHQNNTVVFGADGRAYFGQGSATNSGVVGTDNVARWAERAPGFREIPPVDVVLNGAEFTARAPNALDPEGDDVTAPFRPYGSGAIDAGFVVPGATPAAPQDGIVAGTGAVYSFDPDAADPTSTLRLEAWGLRNPFGLAFSASDPTRLFVSNNGSDIRGQAGNPNDPFNPATYVIRGTRPVAQEYDDLFVLTVGGEVEFFGWPEFFHDPETGQPLLASDPIFCASPALTDADCPGPIFDEAFRNSLTVRPALAEVGLYVSVTGFEPSTSAAFGYVGSLFTTESGSFSPQTGAFEFTGYKVSRIDPVTGAETDFVVNVGSTPEALFARGTLNKPVSAAFLGDRLVIVDLGAAEPGINIFESGTGKVWVVEKPEHDGGRRRRRALRPGAPAGPAEPGGRAGDGGLQPGGGGPRSGGRLRRAGPRGRRRRRRPARGGASRGRRRDGRAAGGRLRRPPLGGPCEPVPALHRRPLTSAVPPASPDAGGSRPPCATPSVSHLARAAALARPPCLPCLTPACCSSRTTATWPTCWRSTSARRATASRPSATGRWRSSAPSATRSTWWCWT